MGSGTFNIPQCATTLYRANGTAAPYLWAATLQGALGSGVPHALPPCKGGVGSGTLQYVAILSGGDILRFAATL